MSKKTQKQKKRDRAKRAKRVRAFFASEFVATHVRRLQIIVQATWNVIVFLVTIALLFWLVSLPNWTALLDHIELLQLALEGLRVVIWPIVVILGVLVFRPQLSSLIANGIRGRTGNTEWELPGTRALEKITESFSGIENEAGYVNETAIPRESTVISNEAPPTLEEFYNDPLTQLTFERTYRGIFGTQLKILQRLENYTDGLGQLALQDIYDEHVRKMSNIPIAPNFQAFMDYLVNAFLLIYIPETGIYKLAPVGDLFLRYLREQKIADPAAKNL